MSEPADGRKSVRSGVAVIESQWWPGYNSSVRGLFDLACDIRFGSHHEYHYEMAATPDALEEVINRVVRYRGIQTVYIASHGSKKAISLSGNRTVSVDALIGMIKRANAGKAGNLSGLYLGTCSFGTKQKARALLEADPKLEWVAGYSQEVNFGESSAVDLLFFNNLFSRRGDTFGKLRRVGKFMSQHIGSLCGKDKLGFTITGRDVSGMIHDLISE